MSAHRNTARLFGLMTAILGTGAVAWFAVILWGQASGWAPARVDAAAQGGRVTGAVALLALGARLLCQYLARTDEAAGDR